MVTEMLRSNNDQRAGGFSPRGAGAFMDLDPVEIGHFVALPYAAPPGGLRPLVRPFAMAGLVRVSRLARPHPAALWGTRGFTLPEVLATMVLIGIVLPVVMRGVSVALSASGHARNMAQAAALGEAKLSELVTLQSMGGVGMSTSGDFSPDWPQYRWQCATQSLEFGAYELMLEVVWMERGVDQSLAISTVVYDNSLTVTESATGAAGTGNTGATR